MIHKYLLCVEEKGDQIKMAIRFILLIPIMIIGFIIVFTLDLTRFMLNYFKRLKHLW